MYDRERWRRDRMVVLPDLIPEQHCADVRAETSRLAVELSERDDANGTTTQRYDERLPGSAFENRIFYDDGVGRATELPPAQRERLLSRLGHRMERNETVRRALFSPAIRALLHDALDEPVIATCAIIDKTPGGSFGYPSHQDNWYITPIAGDVIGVWIAIDDADEENGCLYMAPGSYRLGAAIRTIVGEQWREIKLGPAFADDRSLEPVPLASGSAIIHDGLNYHRSEPNHSARRRRAIVSHFIGARTRLHPDGWLREPPGGFPRLPRPES